MELLMLYSTLLFSLSFLTTKSSAQDPTYVWSICSNTTFPRNSQYQTNLNTVLRSLSTNATANPTGFFSTSAGTTPRDTVYGFYLCRGDQNATACRACVAIATSTDLPKSYCPKGKQAVIWYDQCMVRYSNESLTGGNYSTTKVSLMNTQNIPGNRTRFTDLVRNTMNELAVQVPRSTSKYGTKQVNFSKTQPVYALEQCIPDLTENDCGQCLKYGIGNLMMTQEGAQVLTGSCIVRFEIYPFYNGAVNYTQSSPPAISNSTRGKRWTIELVNNCSYTVWPACSTTSIDFSLPQASSHVIDIPSGSSTRLWARTHCATSSAGNFSCKTGDCGSGQINCFGKFPIDTMPTNMVEFFLRDGAQMDFYDVTLVVGYNVPVMVAPQADGCQATGCIFDVDGACPHVLKRSGACNGPCVVFMTTEYRCNFSASEPNSYSRVFKKACPRANGYDDASTFSCKGAPYYVITYCPSSQIMASAFLQKSHQSSSSPSQLLSPTTSPTISPPGKKQQGQIYLFVAIPIAILIMLLFSIWVFMHRRKAKKRYYELNEIKSAESLQFDLNTIKTATHNFLAENKLGEGGFGEVYKGKLESRQEIAVKRLSKTSGQGVLEFKTEVVLVAKLQHKNLVKLLGFCLESEEKILVYEYLPNSSLDKFLFDPMMHVTLDWQTRLKIIIGIARGLLYLHEDSRLKVIHRDLKTSNILLDKDMNPKISDFGLAKLFGVDQTQGDTNRIVGTYGYMAPEYAITGLYSVKSDVYSFGVILLEIVSGQKSRFFSLLQTEEALLHRAWRLWNARKPLDLVDRTLNNFSVDEVMKCIHIGLLCIQEDAAQRPRMTSIVAAFSSHSISLPMPKPPHFFGNANVIEEGHALDENDTTCIYTGTKTITNLYPRD